ncbi:Delay of germination [Thalictrum thalictroides]|uniref:Delay of germination n=1 Tax=Thalictrum thalictroides TaxID=46969 RepID=A0A7J6VME8_THATH|nr:Delay of germination [Thalictrum thalictroides]
MDEEQKPSKIMPNTSSSNNNSKNNTKDGICFGDFFEAWLAKQKSYLEQLNEIHEEEAELGSLVERVVSHYQNYYETKSKAASENVCLLFSPPWLSSFERTLLWITGFQPGLAFQILDTSVGDDGELTAKQVEKIKRLKAEMRVTEKALSNEMASIQESIGGDSWVKIAKRIDTQIVLDKEVDKVMETMIQGKLRDLVENADFLRANTARELINVLSPVQAAKFLAATARLQLGIHAWGLQRDADRMPSSSF